MTELGCVTRGGSRDCLRTYHRGRLDPEVPMLLLAECAMCVASRRPDGSLALGAVIAVLSGGIALFFVWTDRRSRAASGRPDAEDDIDGAM